MRFPRYVDWSARTGSGSVVTTAGDLFRFVEALFGGRWPGRTALATILAPDEGFAFGWAREERFGRKELRSGGRSPGFNASVERYLDDGTTVIVLTNGYSPVGQDSVFLDGLNSAVFGRPARAPALAAVAVAPGALAELAGRYQLPHDYFVPDAVLTLTDRGDHLDAAWPDGGVNTIYPVGPNRFLDRSYWAELSFTHDGTGKVSGFRYRLLQGFSAKRIGD